ncbi:CoB--CoM heterodisulfide reductase iron-sulfur subunit B family protein [bacterium]|nr:CoB--CoM heterodisulfide reductase iron-sulfur subunit B family protein [bacterium]MBU1984263.1 CoB--CoM heterodisulfide reductase iron-sulfur subunit B family protein [bacterium]
MKFAFFPGCLIPVKYPFMETAIRKTLPPLGIDIVDLPGFTCCPDPIHYKATDNFGWLLIAARNLCVAEQAGLNIFTICSGCTETLSEAAFLLNEDQDLRNRVNQRLAKAGKEYQGTVRVSHIVTVLRDDVGMERIAETIRKPLKGLMVAIHYGCHLLKPQRFMNVDDPDDPRVMDKLIRAIGGTTCRHSEWYLCCGKACHSDSLREDMTRCVLNSVRKMEADCMGMICPSCFSSFDLGQVLIARKYKDSAEDQQMVPPVYYFQLLGLAQGLSPQEVGLDRHKIRPTAMLEKLEIAA